MLTAKQVENAKPREKPYKLYDSDGLFLYVHPKGGRYWRFRYRNASGREQLLSLGVYPKVSLLRARQRRDDAQRKREDGIDPAQERRDARYARSGADEFGVVAERWFEAARTNSGGRLGATWSARHEERTRRFLDKYLLPALGTRRVGEIRAPDVLAALSALQSRGVTDTARRVLALASQILGFAVVHGLAEHNPLLKLPPTTLPSKPVQHRASITDPEQVGQLIRDMRAYGGYKVTRCALELLANVFTRPGEVRLAEWSEIDFDQALWEIPAKRMKQRQPHLVPLSRQSLALLREVQQYSFGSPLVFPGVRSLKKPLSDNTLNAALRQLGYTKDTMTAHGFRAMARTLLDERLGFRVDFIEHQLAHTVRDPLGRAYNRTSFLEERRAMMQRWSDYLDELAAGASISRLHSSTG